tara:strand:- start:12870 stop:13694 length:825 start_codon:yes stop_codon:yes gene_type:complete
MINSYKQLYYLRKLKFILKRSFENNFFRKNKINSTIIYGNQKSGTSAIASLLGMATGKSYIIDVFIKTGLEEKKLLDKKLSFYDYTKKYPNYFYQEIIKEPEFVFFLKDIRELYPYSNYVHILRNPFDNIRSIFNRINITSIEAENSCKLPRALSDQYPLWDLLIDTKRMPYSGTNIFEMLVYRWLYVAKQANLAFSKKPILVKYEDFLIDKIAFIHELCSKLDYEVKNDITAYIDFNFQPKGHRVSKEKFFSNKQIDFIYEICGDEMFKNGYK